jgi:hypothetical protein
MALLATCDNCFTEIENIDGPEWVHLSNQEPECWPDSPNLDCTARPSEMCDHCGFRFGGHNLNCPNAQRGL